MNPEDSTERIILEAYLDGELSAEEVRRFEARLRADDRLQNALEAERQFRQAFQAHIRETRVSPEFRAQMQMLVSSALAADESPHTSAPTWWTKLWRWIQNPLQVPRWAVAVYTMVLILLVGGTLWTALQSPPTEKKHTPFRRLAGKHVVYTEPAPVLDVTGSAEEIRAWFQPRVPWNVDVPQIPGWQLVGGRLGEYHHQPLVYLLYQQDGSYIALMLFTAREDDFPPDARRRIDGREVYVGTAWEHPILLWRKGEVGYALVGYTGQSADELLALFQTLNP